MIGISARQIVKTVLREVKPNERDRRTDGQTDITATVYAYCAYICAKSQASTTRMCVGPMTNTMQGCVDMLSEDNTAINSVSVHGRSVEKPTHYTER